MYLLAVINGRRWNAFGSAYILDGRASVSTYSLLCVLCGEGFNVFNSLTKISNSQTTAIAEARSSLLLQ